MKVQISTEALPALERLQLRFVQANEYIKKDVGPFLSRFIELMEPVLTKTQLESLAPRMVPAKRKAELQRARLLKLIDAFDEKALERLENKAKKKAQETAEKRPFSAENDREK